MSDNYCKLEEKENYCRTFMKLLGPVTRLQFSSFRQRLCGAVAFQRITNSVLGITGERYI